MVTLLAIIGGVTLGALAFVTYVFYAGVRASDRAARGE